MLSGREPVKSLDEQLSSLRRSVYAESLIRERERKVAYNREIMEVFF